MLCCEDGWFVFVFVGGVVGVDVLGDDGWVFGYFVVVCFVGVDCVG